MNSIKEDQIYIHQTVHGYSDGHRLLKSSRSFGPKVERTMLILSDMSGQAMVSGFESYLTGYPLPDERAYALGKTWYAPEMDRPGCVWTHTLVIDFSDLPLIKNPLRLLKFFYRPEGSEISSSYGRPIRLTLPEIGYSFSEPSFSLGSIREVVESILTGLYGSPNTPVFIIADTSEEFETLVLAIWNQQWPRLRRSFSFCTGSISNRKLNGGFFDVQVMPWTSFENVKRALPAAEYVKIDYPELTSTHPGWVSDAADDLLINNNGNLREFLWNFGADESNGRSSFSRLVQVFSKRGKTKLGELAVSDLIGSVAKLYPKKVDGSRLKAAIFGNPRNTNSRFSLPSKEIELLSELCITKKHRVFDKTSLGIRQRAAALWKSDPSKTRNLFLKLCVTNPNPIGEDFLIGFSEVINAIDLISLSKENPSSIYILISKNPELAASEKVWSLPADKRMFILEAIVDSGNISEKVLSSIVESILEAGVSDGVDELPRISETCVIRSVLDWFDKRSRLLDYDPNLQSEWLSFLKLRPSLLLGWLSSAKSPTEYSIALLTGILDPHSRDVLDYGANVWLLSSKRSFFKLDKDTLIYTMSFLLVLGFNNAASEGHKLVEVAYQIVYDAAENDELKYESWRLIVKLVPSLSWWRNWDKCERLRIAIGKKFIQYDWPPLSFHTALKRDETFQQVVNSLRYEKLGREFLCKLAGEASKETIQINPLRRRILSEFL